MYSEPESVSSIAERLRKKMYELGMKQVELAEASGVSKCNVSHYLKGTYEPKDENLNKLARALGVSPSWLRGYPSYETIGEIVEICRELNLAQQDEVLSFAKFMRRER